MRILKAALLILALAVVPVVASAQDEFPKAELAMGYSLVRMSTTGVLEQFTQQGGSTNVAFNFNRKVGLVADFGAYNNNNIRGYDVNNTMFTYLFGPRFSARGEKFTLFGNALFGGAHINGSANANLVSSGTTTVVHIEESNNSFAMVVGGGIDINAGKHFAIRPAQFDYLLTRFNPGSQSETQNCMRYSAMIVFKFGK